MSLAITATAFNNRNNTHTCAIVFQKRPHPRRYLCWLARSPGNSKGMKSCCFRSIQIVWQLDIYFIVSWKVVFFFWRGEQLIISKIKVDIVVSLSSLCPLCSEPSFPFWFFIVCYKSNNLWHIYSSIVLNNWGVGAQFIARGDTFISHLLNGFTMIKDAKSIGDCR